VGTKATVKSLNPEQVKEAGVEVVLGNTYHLYLQPGINRKRCRSIGKFMNWLGPTMTDSGGFQVFSLGVAYGKDISKIIKVTDPSLLIPERFDDSDAPRLAKIGQDGVSFKSHLDGSIHYITPEKSIQIQHNLGADIIFAFDECTSPTEDFRYQEEALERTHRWAERSLKEHQRLSAEKKLPLRGRCLRLLAERCLSARQPARHPAMKLFLPRFLALCKVGETRVFVRNPQNLLVI